MDGQWVEGRRILRGVRGFDMREDFGVPQGRALQALLKEARRKVDEYTAWSAAKFGNGLSIGAQS